MKFNICRLFTLCFAVVAIVAISAVTASAAVVDIDGGSGDPYYSNWAAGNADAANPPAQSYNNYRKGGVAAPPGAPVAADNGDGIHGTWSNLSHNGGLASPCCGNAGMFMGQSPSTSSYSGAQLQIGHHTEPGHSNPTSFDSNGRRTFDLRFGFTEDPSAWVAGKTLTSGDGVTDPGNYDLWTRNHGSDTIYLNIQIGETDDQFNTLVAPIDGGVDGDAIAIRGNREIGNESNRYVQLSAGLKGQSGADVADGENFRGEQDRTRWFGNGNGNARHITNIAAAEPGLNYFIKDEAPTVVDHNNPGLNLVIDQANGGGTRLDTGVGYDDDVAVEWNMELNDPGATAGTKEAREVKFNIRAGGIEYSTVFDPGDAANPVVPNPFRDPNNNTFDDGFFDWENAYPIFYVGPGGGTGETWSGNASDPTGSEQVLGFISAADPNDADGDGDIDGADFLLIQRNGGDIAAWQAAYPGAASAVGAVPEPTSVVLLALGALGLLARRRV